MGYTLKGVCACGYQTANLYCGATQQGILRYCTVPTLDYKKSMILGKDLMDLKEEDNTVSYTDPMLSKSEKTPENFSAEIISSIRKITIAQFAVNFL